MFYNTFRMLLLSDIKYNVLEVIPVLLKLSPLRAFHMHTGKNIDYKTKPIRQMRMLKSFKRRQ